MLNVSKQSGKAFKAKDEGDKVAIDCLEDIPSGYITLEYCLEFETDGSEYLLLPACCYDGNRFDVLKKQYPPMFTPEEAAVDMPVTITDVIRLNKDGSGRVEITTGDVSVPCIGIFSKAKKQAVFLFTIQEIGGINLGLTYEKGVMGITYPHMRKERIYRWSSMREEKDTGLDFKKGQSLVIPYRLLQFPCEDLKQFYKMFFENRKCMGMEDTRPEVLPADRQFEIQKEKFNQMNWREKGRFYGVGVGTNPFQVWQPGWVGGAMSSYALMKLGGKLEQQRALDTLEYLFSTQTESGFFYGGSNAEGQYFNDGFNTAGTENWHLIRKSADVLYFLFKHFTLMKEKHIDIPIRFTDGTKRLADAFVRLWDRYGQFGQFVNVCTGDIVVGGSTSGAIASAGLAQAYLFFGNNRYLEVARQSAELYYQHDAINGYTTGGPGEILQCPDSESAFGLLESFTVLYEVTGEEKWLEYAEFMAWQCSSWVVSYNYRFPDGSEFARLKVKTVGSVFANVQNKHSAPGICTLSGDSLYKLYRWTNNLMYLELLKDIALTISQYMSTNDRPIYSWEVPNDALVKENSCTKAEREHLPQGFICERVNMSDWETESCIGGVFNGSCWCETSNLLALAEVYPVMEKSK